MVLAVAVQRVCAPGPKRDLAQFLDDSLPRVSCLPASTFTGQAFHRLAQQVRKLNRGAGEFYGGYQCVRLKDVLALIKEAKK